MNSHQFFMLMKSFYELVSKLSRLIVFAIVSTALIILVSFLAVLADHYLMGPILIDSACSKHILHRQQVCDGVVLVVELVIPFAIVVLDLVTLWLNKEHILSRLEKMLLPKEKPLFP